MQKHKAYAFTLVELIVAITISVMVLGGVFYLMSITINNSLEARSQSEFLKNFYAFTGIFETGKISLLEDNTFAYDVGLVTSPGVSGGIIFGVIDSNNKKLITVSASSKYASSVFAYRSVSVSELAAIQNSTISVYDLEFQNDKILRNFYIKNLQLEDFNNGDIVDLNLDIFLQFVTTYVGQDWEALPQDYFYSYTLAF